MNKNGLNTSKFDFEEPLEGHAERFEQRLKKKKTLFPYYKYAALVAGLVIVFLYVSLSFDFENPIQKQNDSQVCYNQDLQDLEYFYCSQEIQKIDQIKSYPLDSSIYDQEVLQLDSIVSKFCTELNGSPTDEQVIEAAVNHYQMKINTLDHILNQLNNIHQIKDKENEEINL